MPVKLTADDRGPGRGRRQPRIIAACLIILLLVATLTVSTILNLKSTAQIKSSGILERYNISLSCTIFSPPPGFSSTTTAATTTNTSTTTTTSPDTTTTSESPTYRPDGTLAYGRLPDGTVFRLYVYRFHVALYRLFDVPMWLLILYLVLTSALLLMLPLVLLALRWALSPRHQAYVHATAHLWLCLCLLFSFLGLLRIAVYLMETVEETRASRAWNSCHTLQLAVVAFYLVGVVICVHEVYSLYRYILGKGLPVSGEAEVEDNMELHRVNLTPHYQTF